MGYRRDGSYRPSGLGVVTREAILDHLRRRRHESGTNGEPIEVRRTNAQIRGALGWDGWHDQGAVSEELRSLLRSGLVERHGTKTRPSYSAVPTSASITKRGGAA